MRYFDKRVVILDRGSVVSDGELNTLEQATSHINPASEIASDYSKGAEDYSVYSRAPESSDNMAEEVTEVVFEGGFDTPAEEGSEIVDISSGAQDGGENVVGVAFMLLVNIESFIGNIEQENVIMVYAKTDISAYDYFRMGAQISAIDYVEQAEAVEKGPAYEKILS